MDSKLAILGIIGVYVIVEVGILVIYKKSMDKLLND